MKKLILIFLILLIFVWGFRHDINDFIFGYVTKEINEEMPYDNGKIEVLFCQVDDCKSKLVEYIKKSDKVDCAFYDFDIKEIMDILKGKEYRLIIDDKNVRDVKISNKIDDKNGFMHNKFCILDGKTVSTGSMNPTENDVNKNDNNLVFIESKILSENYEDEFNEMWNGKFKGGEKVKYPKLYLNGYLMENYFCPEDNCEENIITLLNEAKERIYFMTYSFTSDKIGDEAIRNFYYNLDVKGIFDKSQAGSEFSEFNKMKELGMKVKVDEKKGLMHNKVFIIDNFVVLGSYNPTMSGNKKNDENILVIRNKEITDKFVDEFNRIWNFKS